MLNKSNEVLCICVSFQESRDPIKEEPVTKVYLHIFIKLEETWYRHAIPETPIFDSNILLS